jgi:hypothetical protein
MSTNDESSLIVACPGCSSKGILNFVDENFKWCKHCGVILVPDDKTDGFMCFVPLNAPNKNFLCDDDTRQVKGFLES